MDIWVQIRAVFANKHNEFSLEIDYTDYSIIKLLF